MILVDSNVPMYLVGPAWPLRDAAMRFLTEAVSRRVRLVTDAEVFQEILHRYVAIDRREFIGPAYEALRDVCDDVLPIGEAEVMRARDVVMANSRLSARDAIHVAVMQAHDIDRIMTFDRGFDAVKGVKRVP